ncbi:MAG: copper chaperone PCu(A)C [Acetobacteraceae bacterium]|nr:copper chaperone PCu(A)C [Acetobacteraceae bacterium]
MIRRHLLLAALAAALPLDAGAQHPPAETRAGDLVIAQAWSRAAAQGGQGAGYLRISNGGTQPDRLLAASSPAAGRMELHSMIRDGEVMRMREAAAIDIPAGGTVELRPGGLHLMFVGLTQPLRQGETVPVTLRFERAGEVTLPFAIQAAGARGPAHHRH